MIVRVDKIRDCFSLTGPLKPMVRAFITDDADVKSMMGYTIGSEAVNISTNEKWMLRPDGYWHKFGTEETVYPASIYGVTWTVGESNKLSRTDGAVDFINPVPCVNGVGGSSPFDGLMPWAGMQIVEDEFAGTMVSIPKYYYRIVREDDAISIQISPSPADGFAVSPAHMDRGDGKGERDMVYIARYHCGGDLGQSISGVMPMCDLTRKQFRENIWGMSAQYNVTAYSQQDYAMFWTVRLLMLVEYATWDFQTAIGHGCGNGESLENSGKTDDMPYHTGTVGESTEEYCVGVQYRYIEDMWANCAEFIDGWRMDTETGGIYVILNPEEYSDTKGGVLVGQIGDENQYGLIKDWHIPDTAGYTWAMTPAVADMDGVETFTEYVADYCLFGGPVLVSGGSADVPAPLYGPFVLGAGDASNSGPFIGARLQKIP